MFRLAITVFSPVLLCLCTACPTSGEDGDTDGNTETSTLPEVGWFELGFGEESFEQLQPGGELRIVFGSQGAAMFPMPVRAAEFTLPDNPADFSDERAPVLDIKLDIDGTESTACGYFKCVANYPLAFEVRGDGTYEFRYVRIIVPDRIAPETLDGKTARLLATLTPFDSAPLEADIELTVVVDGMN